MMKQIDVISNDEVVWDDMPDSEDAIYDSIRLPATQDVYYYLQARQQDGNIVWASPAWVDDA
jgi:hypothetical protein